MKLELELVDVYATNAVSALYELLAERTPEQSISHKAMPTFDEHRAFVESRPYLAWYLVLDWSEEVYGCCYLSKQREIGVSVYASHRGIGIGRWAVRALMERHPGRFLANVNPRNPASARLFQSFGFAHVQNTFALEPA